ncbi:iron-containing alcohol dehydrogenase [Pelosinus sp. Bkl1]|uniref:Iron-containing alcohol dehydrogenase n=1 Tax=Pelosinus baikalensis TaxID=2892015 RepID=A0ABS8HSP2_9FIRM|nr:iron-containing alcohol dehydrogenase [Pelosinus baikalensis]MCC5465263.1 iron-containing alcohol dehydrogenase [Pelosinus baikalensis]
MTSFLDRVFFADRCSGKQIFYLKPAAAIVSARRAGRREQKHAKLLQYAERVWHIESGSEEEKVDLAIQKTREFFESLGAKTHLSQYGVGADKIPVVIEQLKAHGMIALSETQDLTLDISHKILERAV